MKFIIDEEIFEGQGKRRGLFSGFFTVLLIYSIIILIMFLVIVTNFSVCEVKGDSMNNTIFDKQIVLFRESSSAASGDIVIFTKDMKDQEGTKQMSFIKRVIATEGETIRFNGDLKPDGTADKIVTEKKNSDGEFVPMDESFLFEDMGYSIGQFAYGIREEIPIPEGHYFVLGDNRNDSMDSRGNHDRYGNVIGLVSSKQLLGVVTYIVPKGGFDDWLFSLLYKINRTTVSDNK